MTNIEKLLILAGEFKTIGRLSYDNDQHRQFCSSVLLAVKAAAPDLIKLKPVIEPGREWFITFTGKKFYPLVPNSDDVCIEDIAHHLSMLCRFCGAVRTFYSVAQHSVMISRWVPREMALVALMHDATEAYCNDLIRPIKAALPGYVDIENAIWRVIATKFHLPFDLSPELKVQDNIAVMTERRDLLPPIEHKWSIVEQAASMKIEPLGPGEAEALFLDRFYELTTPARAIEVVSTPSNGAPLVPETASNSRTPEATLSTDGTVLAQDQKAGNDDKSSSSNARLTAARKAGANRRLPSRSASKLPAGKSLASVPPAEQPATQPV